MPYVEYDNDDGFRPYTLIYKFIRSKGPIFITGFLQVMFVAMQPLFIVYHKIFLMMLTGFLISLIWTLNVKRAAFGGWGDRITYATGAMTGTWIGFLISNYLMRFL